MKKEDQQIIEVGYGMAKGNSSFSVGMKAAKQAVLSIYVHAVSAVLVFASVVYDLDEVLQGIHSVVGEAPVFGATTAGEICNGIHKETVLVIALASPFLRVHCGIGTDESKDWRRALNEAVNSSAVKPFFYNASEYKRAMRRQGRDAFIMLFSPGNTRQSDDYSFEIVEALKERSLGEFPIIGGSPADDWRMEQNYILHAQQAYPDSLLVVVFETELQFGISLAHGFRPTDMRATVTAVDGYEILTLDGIAAADVYSKLVGLPRNKLEENHLAYTTGATIGIADSLGQYSVNIANYFTHRGGIRVAQPVSVGTVFIRMEPEPDSMVSAGVEGIRRAIIRGGITDIALGIAYYCALRPRIMGDKSEQEIQDMTKVLAGKPLVGFCSLGEQGVADNGDSRHSNSAVACLVLGSQLSQAAQIAFENNELLAEVEAQKEMLSKTNKVLLKEIAERKKIEAVLRESETKLKDFAQAVPDISLIIDEDGRYIEVFDSGYKLLKRSKEELNGCILHQRFPAEEAEAILRQIRQTILSDTPQCFVHEVEVGEEKRFFEGRTAPMEYLFNGKRTVAAVAIDVTERRKAERLLEFAYELRRKSDFINDIITGNTKVDEQAIATAKTFGIDFSIPLFCCLLTMNKLAESTTEETSSDTTNSEMLKNNIIELLSRDSNYLLWDCRKGIGVLCQIGTKDDDWENSMQFAFQLQKKIIRYAPGMVVRIGVSNMHTGTHCINEGYRQAWSAVVAARCQSESSKAINHFRDIGIAQLLANMGGKKQAAEFVYEKLGKLIDYDHKKGTDLLLTLEKILQNNSLKESAEKMYIHHKTMAFRKKRIEKILGVSIDEFEIKLALAAAVKLYKLSNIFNE
ncbi:PAS domain S-box-containing protein [Sporomusaceae bacterium BoRhaA]|uniref:FIST N-terminal domain-containing protein n=1 Tax=Pelorhabdus rhamnosifermentans TaxID=2772457 RepID=UPI001C0647B6|nr:FIST N-terminal domain-containing protein [Pelorhabdus rhamnosifermentans]MBU2703847.1 PAS domain S-box-containing protein [Pelorhabdus rhamnosifermentans]